MTVGPLRRILRVCPHCSLNNKCMYITPLLTNVCVVWCVVDSQVLHTIITTITQVSQVQEVQQQQEEQRLEVLCHNEVETVAVALHMPQGTKLQSKEEGCVSMRGTTIELAFALHFLQTYLHFDVVLPWMYPVATGSVCSMSIHTLYRLS